MARSTPVRKASRSLAWLGAILIVLGAVLAGGVIWGGASVAPKLALDLEGGTQMILAPEVQGSSEEITPEQLDQAVEIIRQRVDGSGVAEAEITSQSGGKIVVALPGNPSEETLELVRTSAQMAFRPVLAIGNPTPTDATPTPEPTESAAATDPAAPPTVTHSFRGRSCPRSKGRAEPAATSSAHRAAGSLTTNSPPTSIAAPPHGLTWRMRSSRLS